MVIVAGLQASLADEDKRGLKTLRRAMRCSPGIGPFKGESLETVCASPRMGTLGFGLFSLLLFSLLFFSICVLRITAMVFVF